MANLTQIAVVTNVTAIQQFNITLQQANQQLQQTQAAASEAEQALSFLKAGFSKFTAVIAALGIGNGLKQLASMSDQMLQLRAKTSAATNNATQFADVQAALFESAQRNSVGLKDLSDNYSQLAGPIRSAGGNLSEAVKVTDALTMAMLLNGATAAQTAAGAKTLAKAFEEGKLSSSGFNELVASSPRFLQMLADGTGKSVEQVTKLGKAGALTSDLIGNSMLKALPKLNAELAKMPQATGDALTRFQNDLLQAADTINSKTRFTDGIAQAIDLVRELIPPVQDGLVTAFQAVGELINQNKDGLLDTWEQIKGLGGDLWDIFKNIGTSLGAVGGGLGELLIQSGFIANAFTTVRLIIASMQDAMIFLSAVSIKLGAYLFDWLVAPIRLGHDLMHKLFKGFSDFLESGAELADSLGLEKLSKAQHQISGFLQSVSGIYEKAANLTRDIPAYGHQLADSIFSGFADGDTHVNKVLKSLTDYKKAAASTTEVQNRLNDSVGKWKPPEKGRSKAEKKELPVNQDWNNLKKELLADQKLQDEEREKQINAEKSRLNSLKNQYDSIEKSRLDLAKESVEEANKELEIYQRMTREQGAGYEQEIKHWVKIRDIRLQALDYAKWDENKKKLEEEQKQIEAWLKTVDQSLTDLFYNVLTQGSSAFKSFAESIKTNLTKALVDSLYDATVKKAIHDFVGWLGKAFNEISSASSDNKGGDGNSLSNLASWGSMIKKGWSMFSSWFGGGSAGMGTSAVAADYLGTGVGGLGSMSGGFAGEGMATFGGMNGISPVAADYLGTGAGGLGNMAGGSVTTSSAGGAAGGSAWGYIWPLAVIAGMLTNKDLYERGYHFDYNSISPDAQLWLSPVYGWQNKALGGMFGGKTAAMLDGSSIIQKVFGGHNADKQGGSAWSGGGGERWFTPNGYDADLQKMTDSVSASVNLRLKSLGLSSSSALRYGMGFDLDPGGESDNRISSAVYAGDRQIYQQRDRGVGRDAKQFNAAVELEMQRMLLAGLKASELPAEFAKVLNSLDIGQATAEQITAAQAALDAVKQFNEAFLALGLTFPQLAGLSYDTREALAGLAGGLDSLTKQLNNYYQNYYSEAERTAKTTEQLTGEFSKLGFGLPQTRDEFRKLVEAQDLTTESGRDTYAQLLKLADGYAQISKVAEAPKAPVIDNSRADQAAQQAADDARKRAEDLAALMSQIDSELAALGQTGAAQKLADINRKFAETSRQLIDLGGATEANIDKLKRLQQAGIDALGIETWRQLAGAQGHSTGVQAYDRDQAQGRYDRAMTGLWASFGADAARLQAWLLSTGQSWEQAAGSYWATLNAQQKQAVILAGEAKTQYLEAVKAQFDSQLELVKALNDELESVKTLVRGIDNDIAQIEIDAGTRSKTDWQTSQLVLARQVWNAARAGGNTAEIVNSSQEYQHLLLERYQAEKDLLQKQREFAAQLGDYLKSLKTGELSPLALEQRLAEASSQANALITKARGGDVEARGKVQGAIDTELKLGRDYWGNTTGYGNLFGGREADLLSLGADARSDAERQLAALQDLNSHAGSTLAELRQIRQVADGLQSGLNDKLLAAIKTATDQAKLLEALGAGGEIVKALRDLPTRISDTIRGVESIGSGAKAGRDSLRDGVILAQAKSNDVLGAIRTGINFGYRASDLADVWNTANPKQRISPDDLIGLARANGIQLLAQGGIAYEPSVVGEAGPEAVVPLPDGRTIPVSIDWSRYGRGDNVELVAELRQLRAEVAQLKAEATRSANASEARLGQAAAIYREEAAERSQQTRHLQRTAAAAEEDRR
ncbi:tape measure protein [Parachitinimonas caeni]|uniref:Tape measure protein n=1 Tax=Parachitinimonas caeni TaxID=3031301 RepID=A0ABT7DS44_9NEIS|nr:tape measure protein [Parachitinimonas caeni]MDK2122604.1 tape measure protein [Parachitinimonas caeni]